jgi:hypothetical protein
VLINSIRICSGQRGGDQNTLAGRLVAILYRISLEAGELRSVNL